MFASMADKDWRLMLDMLVGVVDEVVLTRVSMERSADPELLARHVAGRVPCRVIEEPSQGLDALLAAARPDDIVLVAGSLYLLGAVRPLVRGIASARSGRAATVTSTL
jgi:dihydrofolate synthase/folylpolyglutamate synthase